MTGLIIASVDKYGRKLDKDEGKRMVKKFYHLEDEDEDKSSSDGESSEEEYDPARGIGMVSTSDESDEDIEDEVESAIVEEDIPKGDATSRLAAVNLDWDNIRAVDILAVLQSFIPISEERVKKVTIYPSEFGKERLQREAVQGPAIFDQTRSAEDEVDTTALRKYQLERLRYYYAIIECSSTSIANVLYKSLDGAELGSTANMLDLRFVPDDVNFIDTPKDEAISVPDDHEPVEFVTDALQHSKLKLTWDAEDPERKRLISEAFKRDAESGKWEALLGSSSDEEETEDVRDKYRQLLLGADTAAPDADDMELGLQVDNAEDEEDSVEQLEETTLEQYKRKERERKHRKREEKQARKESDNPTDLGFNDPFFSTSSASSTKRKEAKRLAKQSTEKELSQKADELELLMHDENNQSGNHFNINHILKHQKSVKHKKKKRDKEKEIDLQEGFKMDLNDPRFQDVYRGGEFAIDPNSAAFRKGLRGMEAVLEESRRRKRDAEGSQSEGKKKKRK